MVLPTEAYGKIDMLYLIPMLAFLLYWIMDDLLGMDLTEKIKSLRG